MVKKWRAARQRPPNHPPQTVRLRRPLRGGLFPCARLALPALGGNGVRGWGQQIRHFLSPPPDLWVLRPRPDLWVLRTVGECPPDEIPQVRRGPPGADLAALDSHSCLDRRRGSSFGGPKRPANWKVAALYLEVSQARDDRTSAALSWVGICPVPRGCRLRCWAFRRAFGQRPRQAPVCRPRRFAIPQRDRTRERSAKLVQSVYTTALAHWSPASGFADFDEEAIVGTRTAFGVLRLARLHNGRDAQNRDTGQSLLRTGEHLDGSLLFADVIALEIALVSTWTLFRPAGYRLDSSRSLVWSLAVCSVWIALAGLYGLYGRDGRLSGQGGLDELPALFHVVILGVLTFLLGSSLTGWADPDPRKLAVAAAVILVAIPLLRGVVRTAARPYSARRGRALIVGHGRVAERIVHNLAAHPEFGLVPVGLVADELEEHSAEPDLPVIGRIDELPTLIRRYDVNRVFVAFSSVSSEYAADVVNRLAGTDVEVDVVPRLFDAMAPTVYVDHIGGLPLIGLPPPSKSRGYLWAKRTLDIAMSAAVLVFMAPILVTAAILIKLDSPGPVLYKHERIGEGGRRLGVLKFRTMRIECCRGEEYGGEEAEGVFARLMHDNDMRSEFESAYKISNDPRVTKVGQFLRNTSIDEFPQLMNVLKGELTLVGPRAVTEDELDRYGPDAHSLMSVRPGVTGYWQINGRSDLDYIERVALDRAYLKARSLRLDLYILAKTAKVLVTRSGAR